MRKYVFSLSSLLLLFTSSAWSQSSSIKGTVTDTVSKTNLPDAVVAVLGKKDSILIKFVRTDKAGNFLIKQLPQDSLIVQVTHPDFADYVDMLKPGSAELNLGSIQMTPKSKLLEEVFVRSNKAIVVKGDTIEYKADSFKVQDGANVKELLKRMPGLQVDKNGQVTAQGKKVEKVLVDGEEFFSDDPAVVIENLRADAIDKVQSYDKKSDQAEFTGVDDGTRSKTLNLVLKEDKKKGLLGKVVIGGGTFDRYSSQAMLNFFKGKKKLSVYGIGSNTGVTGLGWEDRGKFSQGFDMDDAEIMGGGMIMINSGDGDFDDWSNSYNDEGIPRSIKAGAHFSNKWNSDKQNMNGNYSVKNLNLNANGNSLTKYVLPDSSYYSKESHNTSSRQTEQLFSGLYDVKLDSASSLRFKVNGKLENADKRTFTSTESTDDELRAVNRNNRTNSSKSDAGTFLGSVLWRQKFKKKGRTLSLTASYKRITRDSKGFLNSETDFFDNTGFPYRRDTIDQYKVNTSTTNAVSSKLVYTEPAGKKGIVEFNYVFNRTATVSDRKSFDKTGDKYSELNDLYSIRYGLNYLTNSAGVKYQYNGKKITASFGSNIGVNNYIQNDSTGKQALSFQYINLFPTSRFMYKFSAQKNLSLSYTGSPSPPGIDQIQPILENTNPLYVTIGNPELKQSYNHTFSLFYNDYKVLTGRSIWINGSFNPVQNAIVTNQNTVSGVTTQQYVNTEGNYNYYFSGSYGFKLKGDIYAGFDLNTSGSRYVNFINTLKNINNQSSVGIRHNMGKYKDGKYDISYNLGVSYNFSTSSIGELKSNFWRQEHNGRFNYFFTKKLQVGTEINFYLRQKTDAFTSSNSMAIWDASVSYKIFKKNNGVFKLEVNDILKERRGYDRSFTSNYIYERNYNMLGRYGLLSFTWNFTKSPGATK
ncbi:MAG: outer membrane beta-barrel protein [Chitinophagaceae bacterium]